MAILSPDIYDIQNFVNELKKLHIDESEETLSVSTLGYMGSGFSLLLQNNLVIGSEFTNEMFAPKAKYEKYILEHAMALNITDINAVPSIMNIIIALEQSKIDELMVNNVFTLDRDSKIYIENFEFHLEYDIIITKSILSNAETVYTARYGIDRKNPISTVTNPYLQPPAIIDMNGQKFIFVNCHIRQVEVSNIYKKIISNNIIENKSLIFNFDNQLASFDIKITEGSETFYVTPLFEGVPADALMDKYCHYSYIGSNTIKIVFDRSVYQPTLNTDINIILNTTQGAKGEFTYNDNIITTLESENYNYSNLPTIIIPRSKSQYGTNRKSVEELKNIMPKEALSRGSITSNKDLENFFNSIDSSTNKLTFKLKVHNQIERMYYSYLLLKDTNNIITPTNTIDIKLKLSDFSSTEDNRLVLPPGSCIGYNDNTSYGVIINPVDAANFKYTIPFLCVVNRDPMYSSFYLNILDKKYGLNFDYINTQSEIQFISTSITFKRNMNIDRHKYKLGIQLVQNIKSDKGLITLDESGNIISSKVKIIAVISNEKGIPYRYAYGDIVKYDKINFVYDFNIDFITNDIIDNQNYIRIENLYNIGQDTQTYGYFTNNPIVNIYILAETDNDIPDQFRRYDLDQSVPGLEGWTVCNMYGIDGGINFFYNYSHIIMTKTSVIDDPETGDNYILKGVPVVRYDYLSTESRVRYLVENIEAKRNYIDYALAILEDSFGIDFKFYNTYGPSRTFKIDGETYLDRVNLTLYFEIGLLSNADKYVADRIIIDIKNYIENLNNAITSMHISNLITEITNKYKLTSISFIEFRGVNDYPVGYQYFERIDSNDVTIVPEFLNINSADNITPDIVITVV